MSHARGCRATRGWSNSKISVWDNGTRTSNDKQRLSPEDPNFLKEHCRGLEPRCLKNTVKEGTILLRINFR